MTSGPSGFSRQNRPPGPDPSSESGQDPGRAAGLAADTDPLLGGGAASPPAPETSAAQRPRGHRLRRTTLPRATRGWSRSIVWTLIGLTVFGTIYGLIARIDSSIEASGKLRPGGGLTSVSPPFNSLVSEVLVREGQLVRAGQPLLRLRDQALLQQRSQLLAIQAAWSKEVALLAHQLGLPSTLPNDETALRQLQANELEVRLRRLAALEERARSAIGTRQQLSDLEGLRRRLAINREISGRLQRLQSAGGISLLELERQRERQIEVETALAHTEQEVLSGRRRERESTYKAMQIQAANLRQLFTAFDNARQQLRESQSRLVELEERISLSGLTAPLAGRVFDLSVRRGEMAGPARPALKIVPQGGLEAHVAISNRDVGFVRLGMPVEVRVVSFPFTEYGALRGTLVRLSADVLPPDPSNPQESFEAVVRLSGDSLRRDGHTHVLRPGMAVTALLQLGPRPVISLLGDRLTGFLDSTRSIR
ncbi:MAG: HlyD family efflux transporter periplasmic adaptor subunit [Cyanobium sp.]